ncbi:hypothetical protein A3I58_01750 [Candidatus Peregrinibacteria bacterium RIFCSPLOWO2_02_FULL_39_10]|nr:MAG: hypothetical protein A3I58_01750 [Candidatus Peregrinibacteria bacterium RIFCSPLOWO2_02_FULL_39_10]
MKKIFLVSIFVLLFLPACFDDNLKDATVEDVLDKDTSLAVVIDYSDDDQVENLKDLVAKFPELNLGLKDRFVSGFNSKMESEKYNFESFIQPILDGEWKIGASLTIGDVSEIKDESSIMNLFNIAVQVSEADKFKELMEYVMKNNFGEFEHDIDDGVDYYRSAKDNFYMMKYGDLFVITRNEDEIGRAVNRIEDESGLKNNEKFNNLLKEAGDENLGYVFVDGDSLKSLQDIFAAQGMGAASVGGFGGMELGDTFISIFADRDGFRGHSFVSVEEGSNEAKEANYNLHFIDEVNGEGMFLYFEQPGFRRVLKSVLDSLGTANFSGVTDKISSEEEVGDVSNKDYYGKFIEQAVSVSGLTVADVEKLLDSPFAFAMSDAGGLYPTIAVYLKLNSDAVSDGKSLVAAVGFYVDKMIVQLDDILAKNGVSVGVLKKDVAAIQGGMFYKIYVDWTAFAVENLNQFGLDVNFDFKSVPIEFYYGVTGDNELIVALYQGFDKVYGKNVLASSEEFKDAVSDLEFEKGFSVGYFRFDKFFDILERDAVLVGAGDPNQLLVLGYAKQIFAFFSTVQYIVSTAKYEDGVLKSESFARIEEVKGKL